MRTGRGYDLLLSATRVEHTPDLVAALGGTVDWQRVLALARWHRLEPLLFDRLRDHADGVPARVFAELELAYLTSAARQLQLSARLEEILDALVRAGIPVVILKGAALIRTVYADPALRPMADVDILVTPADAVHATAMVATLGFTARRSPSSAIAERKEREHQHLPVMVSDDGLAAVEIHTHVVNRRSGLYFPLERFWQRARPLPGRDGSVSLPAPVDLLLHLCLHFLVDRRHSSAGALAQLRDISLLLAYESSAIDFPLLASEATADGHTLALYLALAAARDLLAAPIDGAVLAALDPSNDGRTILEAFVARRVLRARAWFDLELFKADANPLDRLWPDATYMAERYGKPREPSALLPHYLARLESLARLALLGLRRPWEPVAELRLNRKLRGVARAGSRP